MLLTTHLRNWNDLLTDNGLVRQEAGSRAKGEGNQCFFLAHALAVASEGDLRGSKRDRTDFLGGWAQHNKEGLCRALENDLDWKDYFRKGKYGGGLTVGRTDAQWANHVRLRGTTGSDLPAPVLAGLTGQPIVVASREAPHYALEVSVTVFMLTTPGDSSGL